MTAQLFVVPKVEVPDAVKRTMLDLLDRVRNDVISGEVSTIVLVSGTPDDKWSNEVVGDCRYSDIVFHLGVTQHTLIDSYLGQVSDVKV